MEGREKKKTPSTHNTAHENNAVTTVNHSASVENTALIPKPLALKN